MFACLRWAQPFRRREENDVGRAQLHGETVNGEAEPDRVHFESNDKNQQQVTSDLAGVYRELIFEQDRFLFAIARGFGWLK